MVVSESIVTGMLFSLATSVTVPIIFLMILMLKIKPKGVLAFMMCGFIAIVAGPIICGTVLGTILTSVGIQSAMINNILTAIFLLAGIIGMTIYISPGGIEFNQTVIFGASASLVYSIFYNALEIMKNIMIVNYLKMDNASAILGEDSESTIALWKETVANFKAADFFVSGYLQILLIVFIIAIILVVVNGLINKKIVIYSLAVAGIYLLKEVGYTLLVSKLNSIVAAIYATLFAIGAGYYIYSEFKKKTRLMSQIEAAKLKNK